MDISRLRQNLKGHITFGISVPSNLLPMATIDALSKHPELRLTIIERPPHVLVDMVRKKELEFALCTSALVDTSDPALATRHLFIDERLVVAGANHPYFARDPADVASLLKDLWILPPPGFVTAWLADCFARLDLPPPVPKVETTSTTQMINALESQRFVTVLPATAIRRQLDQGAMRAVAPEHLAKVVDILAVHSARRPLSRIAVHLLDSIAAGEETSKVIRLGEYRKKKTAG